MFPHPPTRRTSAIARRLAEDGPTRLRVRYAPYYHALEHQRGPSVRLRGRELVMLSSNDYLGLAFDPRVIEASQAAAERWGTATNGARLANGSRTFHEELERSLAGFLGKAACHVSAAGYLSCMSAVAAFAQRGDIIVADKNLHACMWDGARLSGAQIERFAHNDPADLARLLSELPAEAPKLLAIEGVYSMEGHTARLPELLEVAERHRCFVVLDDAHGLGVLGPEGAGTAAQFGCTDRVDLICGSLSKSLASTGGFIAGSTEAIEYLRTHSRQTIFAAAISPGQAAAAEAALRILRSEPAIRERLWRQVGRYREALLALGLDLWGSETPAIPIVIGDQQKVYRFWEELLREGVFTVISVAPGVPPGKDLIRTAISAGHTDAQLDFAIAAIAKVRRSVLG